MNQPHPNWSARLVHDGQAILNQIDFTNVTPRREDVLKFMVINPLAIKVVILGQDPYPTPGVANGRAFAVANNAPLPGSLQNLFKEIKQIKGRVSTKPDLAHWEAQGVLLLNSALTTKHFHPGAHRHLWKGFVAEVLAFLNEKNPSITWVLWGRDAQALGSALSGNKILEAHPSPLSAHLRTGETFRKLTMIDW